MINVTKPSMPTYEEYCKEIKVLWENQWLTNSGIKHQEFQNALEEYLNIKHITLYTNGHLALENAIAAMDLPKEGEVITTPFTFISTTHAIVRNGLKPVFCDINEDFYTINTSKIEQLITDKTCAIVPVHVYGNVCDVEAIESIANNYNLRVIYDAAHAFGVKYKNRSIAKYGDATMFSFHATKVFNTIEGGAVCHDNSDLELKLERLKNFGATYDDVLHIGSNAKMSEFQAAMGICNLRHFDNEMKKRELCVKEYRKFLRDEKGIKICFPQDNVTPNYAYFPIVVDGSKYKRNEIIERLKNNGIYARKYFYPLTNDVSCYKDKGAFNSKETPVAKSIAERVIALPLYADLDVEHIMRICEVIIG